MANKLMYIPNDDALRYLFCRLQLLVETRNEPTNENIIEVPKFVRATNKKTSL